MERDDEHVFGVPGAESLQDSAAAVWESELDGRDAEDYPFEIEEWTVRPIRDHFPSADTLIEYVMERWLEDEVDEYFYEDCVNAARTEEAEEFLSKWASRVHYRMADNIVATHQVTLVDGEPYLDGEPMYVRSPDAGDA